MAHTIAVLDCSAGVTGPLILGALLDIGLDFKSIEEALSFLPAPLSHYAIVATRDNRAHGTAVDFEYKGTALNPPTWHLNDTRALLQENHLESRVRQRVLAMVERMAGAISKARDIPAEDVEIITHKPLLALISVVLGLDMLHLSRLYASSLPLTPGYQPNERDNSTSSIAPETLHLLTSIQAPWHMSVASVGPISLEGAALLTEYATFEPASDFTITQVGYGLPPAHTTNAPASLRLCLAHPSSAASPIPPEPPTIADTDQVTVIETNIDNMSGELLGALMDRLLDLGAFDVSYTPMQMKKNRPATLVRVICKPEDGERLSMILLSETTTLGVRLQSMRRLKAHREQRSIQTPFGPIQVKLKLLGDRIISAAPEYEECARVARIHSIPLAQVYEVAHNEIQALIDTSSKQ